MKHCSNDNVCNALYNIYRLAYSSNKKDEGWIWRKITKLRRRSKQFSIYLLICLLNILRCFSLCRKIRCLFELLWNRCVNFFGLVKSIAPSIAPITFKKINCSETYSSRYETISGCSASFYHWLEKKLMSLRLTPVSSFL